MIELFIRAYLALWGDLSAWELYDAPELPADTMELVDPMDPLACSQLVDAAFQDVPAGFVANTCIMESGCYRSRHVSIHAGDVAAGRSAFERSLRSGRLDGDCGYVRAARGVGDDWAGEWSTRGAHGLIVAYQLFRVGSCLPPEAMDIPLVSALAAGRKARWHCQQLRARGKKCTSKRLRCAWAMAPLGSSHCGRVIRRWKKRLKRYKSIRTNVDWERPPTVREIRRTRETHRRQADDAEATQRRAS